MTHSGLLLAFDTSTPTARVALFTPAGDCIGLREKTAARHSANLLALCDEALHEGGVRPADLEAIACGAGPGSFTGLRVGLAVAKGLALPSGRPLVLVSSLDALAADLATASADAALLLPCIDAGKGQVYARLYRRNSDGTAPLGDTDWAIAPAELCGLAIEQAAGQSLLAGGTGVDRFASVFRQGLGEAAVKSLVPGPSAKAVAALARVRLQNGEHDALESAVPRYGRAPDITRPKNPLLTP